MMWDSSRLIYNEKAIILKQDWNIEGQSEAKKLACRKNQNNGGSASFTCVKKKARKYSQFRS
jgi:hypothetical protein